MEQFLELPVLCSVPVLVTDKEKRRSRITSWLSYLFLALVFVGIGVVMVYFWKKGAIVLGI